MPPAACTCRTRSSNGRYVLRLAVGNADTSDADVRLAWDELNVFAEELEGAADSRPGEPGQVLRSCSRAAGFVAADEEAEELLGRARRGSRRCSSALVARGG